MKASDFKGTKGLIVIIVLILLVVGYFYYLSNRKYTATHEEDVVVTPAQELLLRDFKTNYPPTPKEVVKQYLEFTKVLHNEDLEDEEVDKVAIKLQELFDEELVANKSEEDYLKDLKSELKTFQDNDYSIVNMYTSASTDVEEFFMDNHQCASLYGTFNIRTGSTGTKVLREIFILRRDEAGHWKIYGFMPMNEDPNASISQN